MPQLLPANPPPRVPALGTLDKPADLAQALRVLERWCQQVLVWLRSGPVAPQWFGATALPGADGIVTEFTLDVTLWLDVLNRPVVVVLQGGSVCPYSDTDPPPAGTWHLRLGTPQVMVFGTAPVATDQIISMAVQARG